MDLRVFYVCEQVITEDGVSHSQPPEPGLLQFTDVDERVTINSRFIYDLKCRIADTIKKLPWILEYKRYNNCWGSIDFDMKYRSLSSGHELIPFNHFEPERNDFIAVGYGLSSFESRTADLWIKCKVYMDTPINFLDAILGRPQRRLS